MVESLRSATELDTAGIAALYRKMNRPHRPEIRWREYLVAIRDDHLVGCAGVQPIPGGGYLYGLAVHRDCRRRGLGSALTMARLARMRTWEGRRAIALAMFWNMRFFRSLGFETTPREALPESIRSLPDFQDKTYRRSAVVQRFLP